MKTVRIVGAGLAGSEAAYRLASAGVSVELIDIKPRARTAAHHSGDFAELVCSNSLKGKAAYTAAGLLKLELEVMGSFLIETAKSFAVDAGGALAVDRHKFASSITGTLSNHPNITTVCREYTHIEDDGVITIIATGPMVTDTLATELKEYLGTDNLAFYDAAAPIVTKESIDMDKAFYASRYGQGSGDDYINCPMDREQYYAFCAALSSAERVIAKSFEGKEVFEGCMPIEVMASRGADTMRFGPLKPVGITKPDGTKPFAVVQLRAEDNYKELYNIVGFQTNLKFGEQKRVFGLIPGLSKAEFVRYGVMHRNTFINAPQSIDRFFRTKRNPRLLIAGQLSGVEGYVESIMSGLIAADTALSMLRGEEPAIPDAVTMTGALCRYLETPNTDFQPMSANFGILPPCEGARVRDKRLRGQAMADRALSGLDRS